MAEINRTARSTRWAGRLLPRLKAVLICAFGLAFLSSADTPFSVSQDAAPTEPQVEAAYLYNFGKFVTWPVSDRTSNSNSFLICVLGKDPFGSVLDATVAGEKINEKKIAVHRISRIQDGLDCNILFVSSSEENHLSSVLLEARRMHLLTVSNIPHFAERGGTIGLVNQQDRIRFEVNRATAEQSHLILSSELLKVAVRVIQTKQTGS